MEQGSNLGAQFVANNYPTTQQQGFYPNMPQNPQVPMQQGQVFNRPQVLVDINAVTVMNQNNTIRNIEVRISTGFCCYTCLVWFEMLVVIAAFITTIAEGLQGAEIATSTLTAITLVPGCILALIAKNQFDAQKQNIAFILFILSTIIGLLTPILALVYLLNRKKPDTGCIYNYYDDGISCSNGDDTYGLDALGVVYIIDFIWQLIIGLTLILNSRSLMMLMRTRDSLISDNKDKLDMNVFGKV